MADQDVVVSIKSQFDGAGYEAEKRAREALENEARRATGSTGQGWSESVAQQHPQTVERIRDLYQTKAAYTSKGMTDAARTLQQDEINPLEHDLHRAWKENLGGAQETLKNAREHTRELRDQRREVEVIGQAQESYRLKMGRAAVQGFERGSGAGEIGGLLAGLANPGVLAALAGGVVVGELLNDKMFSHQLKLRQQQELGENAGRRGLIETGIYGDDQSDRSGAAAADRARRKSELDEALAKRGKAEDEGGFSDWWKKVANGVMGAILKSPQAPHINTSGDKANEATESKISTLLQQQAAGEKLADAEALKGPIGAELARRRAIVSGDMAGARAAKLTALLQREFHAGNAAGLSPDHAGEYAKLAGEEELRSENMKFGRLVNARSSAGDIERAALLASGRFGGGAGGSANLERLIADQTRLMVAQRHDAIQRETALAAQNRPPPIKNLRGE